MARLHKAKILDKLAKANSKVFTAWFLKKDLSERMMNAEEDVVIDGKGGPSNVDTDESPYHTTYDVDKKEYRVINLDTVFKIIIDGETYDVIK